MKLAEDINLLPKKEFLSIFGNIFEKSEWIADEAFKLKPFKDSNDLIVKMMNIYDKSPDKKIINIFNLHPKLAIEKKLTSFSSKEQADAKLNSCTKEELMEFEKLNLDYQEKFGFPFIIAVKGKTKIEVLKNFKERIKNNYTIEFEETKLQVKKIASIRLEELLK